MHVLEYINVTTWANHYCWPMEKKRSFLGSLESTLNLGKYISPNKFYTICLQYFIQKYIAILLWPWCILLGSNTSCQPFFLLGKFHQKENFKFQKFKNEMNLEVFNCQILYVWIWVCSQRYRRLIIVLYFISGI